MRAPVLALTLVLAAPVLAQVPSPGLGGPQGDPVADAFLTGAGSGLRGSKLSGVDVIDLNYNRVGEIKDVLLGRDGRVEAVILGVGGVLGIGEKDVAVRFDRFLWNTGASALREGPSASLRPENAPPPPSNPAERLPGQGISDEVLRSDVPQTGVNPASGPVSTGSTAGATVIAGDGDPVRAQVRLTREQLEKAPAFRPDGRR
ncbi:MAG TPA: PRC-barrel domain-containing protein [Salinarimonas sp.]|nr:PRC-barrel domain-containing protein [Salinarimonas sp.]